MTRAADAPATAVYKTRNNGSLGDKGRSDLNSEPLPVDPALLDGIGVGKESLGRPDGQE